MTHLSLTDLGWSDHFAAQLSEADAPLAPARITAVARSRLRVLSPDGSHAVTLAADDASGAYAVGDWVLIDPETATVHRRLERSTVLARPAGHHGRDNQLIAANVDTLGIVTSCNADFNPARLERYLALAAAAGALPLIILTKADQCDDAARYVAKAQALSPLVTALALNARDKAAPEALAPWCRAGQTLALVGSSGVGKSTLSNALTGGTAATQGIREDDAKGRHTTSARGMARTVAGGWLIDTPGMRALPLGDVGDGIAAVFADLTDLTTHCRFSDCSHTVEPGCAILQAVADGTLEPDRVDRWRKLQREDAHNTATLAEARSAGKSLGGQIRHAQKAKRGRR